MILRSLKATGHGVVIEDNSTVRLVGLYPKICLGVILSSMRVQTARDKFYAPLKQVAQQYLPMLMSRLKILENRSIGAMDFLDAEADTSHEYYWELDETERIATIASAQADLHKAVLEAGTCQALVGAFIELLQEEYPRIRDSSCFFVGPDGQMVSLYEGQVPDIDEKGS